MVLELGQGGVTKKPYFSSAGICHIWDTIFFVFSFKFFFKIHSWFVGHTKHKPGQSLP